MSVDDVNKFREKIRQSIATLEIDEQKFVVDLDEDILEVAMEVLPEAMETLLNALNAALKNKEYGDHKDAGGIAGCAHQLKGMAGMAGYPEISVLGEQLERAAIKQDFSRCEELINLLKAWNELRIQ
jgi:HPt (histidine-containing phosphotransfer) domain-containing protein